MAASTSRSDGSTSTPDADWAAAARAHAEVFGVVKPANTTLYVHALIGDDFLVEVEVDAGVQR